jgi:hypothetical protein
MGVEMTRAVISDEQRRFQHCLANEQRHNHMLELNAARKYETLVLQHHDFATCHDGTRFAGGTVDEVGHRSVGSYAHADVNDRQQLVKRDIDQYVRTVQTLEAGLQSPHGGKYDARTRAVRRRGGGASRFPHVRNYVDATTGRRGIHAFTQAPTLPRRRPSLKAVVDTGVGFAASRSSQSRTSRSSGAAATSSPSLSSSSMDASLGGNGGGSGSGGVGGRGVGSGSGMASNRSWAVRRASGSGSGSDGGGGGGGFFGGGVGGAGAGIGGGSGGGSGGRQQRFGFSIPK